MTPDNCAEVWRRSINSRKSELQRRLRGASDKMAAHYIDDRSEFIREFLASEGVDFDRACTFATDSDCWLARTLSPWNNIFSVVDLELTQPRPRALCLGSRDTAGNTGADVSRIAAYLFKWLPEQHVCVQSRCLHYSLSFKKPLRALNMLFPSSAHLRHLTVKGHIYTAFSERDLRGGMAALKTLENFEFVDVGVTSRDLARAITALLRENGRHLIKVRFERNGFSRRSTASILCALLKYQVLSELSFAHNHLKKSNIKTVAVILRSLRNLKKLSLDLSIRGDEPVGPVAKALESNVSLQELSLKDCNLQVVPLFEALHTNTNLKLLDLERSTMTFSKVKYLATALSLNKGLKTVLLQQCQLNEESIAALANVMTINETLEQLELSDNPGCPCICDLSYRHSPMMVHTPRSRGIT
ncbi:hypothetical protein MRX96_024612 [Rhipicephalus microplus]